MEKTEIVDREPRVIFVWLLYNWKLRTKRFFTNDLEGLDSIGEFCKTFNPSKDESLYLLSSTLEFSEASKVGQCNMTFAREDDSTKTPLKPGQSLLSYVADRVFAMVNKAIPPLRFNYKDDAICTKYADYSEEKAIAYVSIPDSGFKVTIEKTEPWQFGKEDRRPWEK